MPIKHATTSKLTQVCANCKRQHEHAYSKLTLGNEYNADVITLPVCVCGAVECLIRTWDITPEGEKAFPNYRQRCAVNAIAQKLKSLGRSHLLQLPKHVLELKEPTELAVLPLSNVPLPE